MYEYRPPDIKILYYIIGAIAALVTFALAVYYYTEYIWFKSVGYGIIFVKMFQYSFAYYGATFLLFFSVLFINNIIIRKVTEDFLGEPFKIPHIVDFLIAVLLLLIFRPFWPSMLFYINAANFGIKDPIFGLDASFYTFKLPFIKVILAAVIVVLFIALLFSIFIYAYVFRWVRDFDEFKEVFPHIGFIHLAVLTCLVFVFAAALTFVSRYDLLYSQHGVVSGASYVDVHIKIPAITAMAGIVFICGLLSAYLIVKKEPELITYIILAVFALYIISVVIVPFAVEKFQVEPNQLAYESKYINYSIHYTLYAYGLNKVDRVRFYYKPNLTYKEVMAAKATIDNVRIWDHRPIKDVFKQLQQIRTYYVIHDVDVDRYHINGSYVQVMIAARELDVDLLPSTAQTWLNRHLIYTHGYGVVAAPVNSVSKEGLPKFIIYDIPPRGEIKITRPEIYYGELTNNYVVVNTSLKEFDYPKGNVNYFTHYKGDGGIKLNYWTRLLFSIRFGDVNLLLSKYIRPGSRLMIHRNIKDRVETLMPFLKYDNDPYIAVINGKLYWIIDAYSCLYGFPYSAEYDGINYMRNPVKIFIDAYNGTVNFYIIQEDAYVKTLENAFPGVFKHKMPECFRKHIRYPKEYFKIQAEIYAVYHMTNVREFYNREDVWEIPQEKYENNVIEVQPYYVTLSLGDGPEFILMLPFTPKDRNNLIAWMAARCDRHYGQLIVYDFPKGVLIFGPMQIDARIDQNANLSKLFTLWGQVGSRVIRGNLLVIPINHSLLYIEPIYLRAVSVKIPELRGVVVVQDDVLKMGPNLYKAIDMVFGVKKPVKKPVQKPLKPSTAEQKLKVVKEYYQQMIKYLKEGKWSEFGKMLEKIGSILGVNSS